MNANYLIPSGLKTIPRQIALFPEFRAEMLEAIPEFMALYDWRARRHDDFGRMLLEMWAYCCDVLSFYDETIAHECYLRTARQRASLRRLVGLLGYVPRPALAASVHLALLAEGKQPVTLSAGLAFRSSAFSGHAPQIFEMDLAATIFPQNNQGVLEKNKPSTFGGNQAFVLLKPEDATLSVGDYAMLRELLTVKHVTTVTAVKKITGNDGASYVRVDLQDAVPAFATPIALSSLRLRKPLRKTGLWNLPRVGTDALPVNDTCTELVLNGVVPDLQAGYRVLVECGGEVRWFTANKVEVVWMQPVVLGSTTMNEGTSSTVKYTFNPPVIRIPATKVTLDTNLNDNTRKSSAVQWTPAMANQMTVHFYFYYAGTVTREASMSLAPGDPLAVSGKEELVSLTGDFLMEDVNQNGVGIGGTLNAASRSVTPDQDDTWDPALKAPVSWYGNVVGASRGETVSHEIVGSGDASIPSQSFKLKKKPLTYLADNSGNSDLGAASTLKLYVNNVLWKEVPSFFGAGPGDFVYVVRHNDDGEAVITGGDGIRGMRFPTGVGNLVAFYRFGAGAATPPAGGITQPAKPVKGLKSVFNPVAAIPGSDAQNAESIRKYAPNSALLLGRAVSIQDFEAATGSLPGVRAVQAVWCWNEERLQPVVQVWVIGPDSNDFREKIYQALHALSDPSMPIDVKSAAGLPRNLNLAVDCDPNQEDRIIAEIKSMLLDPETGILAPENVGIGKPLYRSRIFDAVLSVEGAKSVSGIYWEGAPFTNFYPENPTPGAYYDFEKGSLAINGLAPYGVIVMNLAPVIIPIMNFA